MPINVNQFNPAGLAQLAGGVNIPRLDLPLFGNTATPNAALFDAMKQKDQQQNQMNLQNLQGQQAMGLSQFEQQQVNQRNSQTLASQQQMAREGQANQLNIAKMGNDVDYARLDQNQNQFGQTLDLQNKQLGVDAAYKGKSLDLEQQKVQTEKMVALLTARAAMTKQEREQKSALAGAYLSSVQGMDPSKRDQFDQMYIKNAIAHGDMTEEEGKSFLSVPLEMRPVVAKQDYLLTEKASELAKLQGSQGSQGITITQPDGTVVQVQGASKPVQTALQTDIKNNLTQLDQLQNIGNKFADNYLTYAGKAKNAVGGVLSSLGLPEGDFQKFSQNRAGFVAALDRYSLEFVKAMSGVQYSDKQLEAMKTATVSSSDNPAEFKGKFNQLTDFMRSNIKTVQDLTKQGIPVGSPDFQAKFDERIAESLSKINKSETKAVPMSEIQQVMKAKGMTQEQVESTYNVKGQ